MLLKFEKATRIWEISALDLTVPTLLCRFRKILWPSQNIWTLHLLKYFLKKAFLKLRYTKLFSLKGVCLFSKSDQWAFFLINRNIFVYFDSKTKIHFSRSKEPLCARTVIQNPRSRSLIQKWSSYKKYFFYALGSSLHYIFW